MPVVHHGPAHEGAAPLTPAASARKAPRAAAAARFGSLDAPPRLLVDRRARSMGEDQQLVDCSGMDERHPRAPHERIAELPPASPTEQMPEWDFYAPRKPFAGSLGAMRNDRTPLNTPYTPQLVKMHMKTHQEYDEASEAASQGVLSRVTTAIRSKVTILAAPVRKIRSAVDKVVTWAVPQFVQRLSVFATVRPWIVSYFTAVICVPIAWLFSPMIIALIIFTSPVWSTALVALVIRQLVPASSHQRLSVDYPHSSDLSTTTEEDHDELGPPYMSSPYRQADFNGSRMVN